MQGYDYQIPHQDLGHPDPERQSHPLPLRPDPARLRTLALAQEIGASPLAIGIDSYDEVPHLKHIESK